MNDKDTKDVSELLRATIVGRDIKSYIKEEKVSKTALNEFVKILEKHGY